MYFAANEQISRAPISGGIEITPKQFAEAQAAIAAGQMVTIVDDQMVIEDRPPLPHVPVPKPKEIEAQQIAQAKAIRAAAYTAEADPLFFKWQAGKITDQEWLAKRDEIRERYPYPQD